MLVSITDKGIFSEDCPVLLVQANSSEIAELAVGFGNRQFTNFPRIVINDEGISEKIIISLVSEFSENYCRDSEFIILSLCDKSCDEAAERLKILANSEGRVYNYIELRSASNEQITFMVETSAD